MKTERQWMGASRRTFVHVAVAGLALAAAGIGTAPIALADVPALPKSPVTINIVDVAGNLH